MHAGAFEFVRRVVTGHSWQGVVRATEPGTVFRHVVDLGGRDINGSPRRLFPGALYTSVDLLPGPGVDVVADASTWQPPDAPDCVLCLEVLEHTPDAEAAAIVANALRMLAPGGLLVLTMASPLRQPHSAIDGGALLPGEFYRGVSVEQLKAWLDAAWPTEQTYDGQHRFRGHRMTVEDEALGDLYVWAVKGA